MNRRQFFGMTVAAVAAAGLPALVLPEKKLFLPPRDGWFQTPMRMREIRMYCINDDSLPTRFDAVWIDRGGERHQRWVQFPPISGLEALQDPQIYDRQREIAAIELDRIRRMNAWSNAMQGELMLPRGGVDSWMWEV